ncbi:anaerobic nitric oxide reductase transcription regulator [Biostraticola tofi]|uniref:Anaerobic nitric oxide reductase transcription regulator n=2 Tax=Biostraticola tofi TaxID=466109 RepID=A0A4R3YS69_9GAMM|nr:anaerobic nitric oxide reductase transcription regulator [Biostraticola tofi]
MTGMTLSVDLLATIALELQNSLSQHDRFQRLVNSLRQLLRCDASALLRYEASHFHPLATSGLASDVAGRRFKLADHPRLEAIARAGDVVRFPADSELPDPFDCLIPHHDKLKVHACIGLPLFAQHELIGALTFDDLVPGKFDGFSDEELRLISALASAALSNALLLSRLERQSLTLPENARQAASPVTSEMIGRSAAMQQLKKEIAIVAGSGLNVLITGETGVGKELVAQGIHRLSPQANKALVYLNCAALPENVAESELFGHVKGAFTGAIHHRVGKFEMADNGTLFLDEIGELSLSLQAKLLRVLQYGDLQRVGDDSSRRVNVRVLAATNRCLKQAVEQGGFRADLFHRLSVFPMHVPPLRQRVDDIVLLAGFFIEQARVRLGIKQLALNADAIAKLEGYSWPGNIRELEHTLYRAAVMVRAAYPQSALFITPSFINLPEEPPGPPQASAPRDAGHEELQGDLQAATRGFQRRVISATLAAHQGNWSASARTLGLDTANLHRLAKRLGLK